MTDIPVKPHLLTVRQVAIIIQVHPNTVMNYVAAEKLRGSNPNGTKNGATGFRITVESVKEFIRKIETDQFNEANFDAQVMQVSQHVMRSSRRQISSGIR